MDSRRIVRLWISKRDGTPRGWVGIGTYAKHGIRPPAPTPSAITATAAAAAAAATAASNPKPPLSSNSTLHYSSINK